MVFTWLTEVQLFLHVIITNVHIIVSIIATRFPNELLVVASDIVVM